MIPPSPAPPASVRQFSAVRRHSQHDAITYPAVHLRSSARRRYVVLRTGWQAPSHSYDDHGVVFLFLGHVKRLSLLRPEHLCQVYTCTSPGVARRQAPLPREPGERAGSAGNSGTREKRQRDRDAQGTMAWPEQVVPASSSSAVRLTLSCVGIPSFSFFLSFKYQ